VEAIGKQSSLPESITTILVTLLKDTDQSVQQAAVEAIGKQSSLPESITTILVTLLKDTDRSVRGRVVESLSNPSIPLENILTTLGWPLLSQRSPISIGPVPCNLWLTEYFYEVMLRRSFREQFSLYFDGTVCHLNQPSEHRGFAFTQHDARRFRTAIERRKVLPLDCHASSIPDVKLESWYKRLVNYLVAD